jgi:hypothetical protein
MTYKKTQLNCEVCGKKIAIHHSIGNDQEIIYSPSCSLPVIANKYLCIYCTKNN